LAQGGAVGIFAIRESVIDSGGILHHFGGGARHGRNCGSGRRHLPEPVRVHGQPVEDGAHVHVGTQFGAGIVNVAGLVGEDDRIVDALLPAQQVIIDGHVHRAFRRLEPHFRLVASVIRGVHGQRINGIRQNGPAGVVEVKVSPSPAIAPGQKVYAVIDETRDVPVGRIDDEGDDAVGQRDVRAVLGHGHVGTRTGAATGDVGERRNRRYKEKKNSELKNNS
jgi:hypothetical protein